MTLLLLILLFLWFVPVELLIRKKDRELFIGQFVNSMTLISQKIQSRIARGSPDLTISSRAYINRNIYPWNYVYTITNALFFFQEDHCYLSYKRDVAFAIEIMRIESERND